MNSAQLGQLLIGNDIIKQHIAKMRVPGEWATQVELQAATEVYCRALYLYTLTPAKDAYQWHCYMPKTRSPIQGHIELAHPSGVHFEVVVDSATNTASETPPQLTGKTVVHPGTL